MRIGVPKEIKNHEYRVGLTPAGAHALTLAGHEVWVQANAGARIGFADADYLAAGARIAADAAEAYGRAEMVIKVKELQAAEFALTRPGQLLFAYQHFAPDADLLQHVLDCGLSCVAYETVTDAHGELPLLAPMSRVAGRLAPQVGAWALQMANGSSGVLLGGVAGVAPGKVVIVGAGNVGTNALQIAVGMGAQVTLFDRGIAKIEALDRIYRGRIATRVADPLSLEQAIAEADLVIGAVLIPGKLSPRFISRALLRKMRPGSVIVDVGIDQGGIAETSRPTSHSDPLFVEEGIVHYCVPNMPASVARTSTQALTQATLPYALRLANLGLRRALAEDAGLMEGLQAHGGKVTHAGLAEDTKRPFTPPADCLA
ncbi:MAG: alanine dehydrogenase [Betaproteobacteria bacterium]|nr:alanine dehydrogenase [Betaproteobacteria bacterium]